MTRLFVAVVVTFALISGTALAQSTLAERGPFGLGAMFGLTGPSVHSFAGVKAKYFLNESHAIDGAILGRIGGDNDFSFHVDYLYHFRSLITLERGELPVYLGVGPRYLLQENDQDEFGIRFPVGLAYEFADVPVDIFIEVAPVWDVDIDYDFDLEGGVGVRFYF